jgi:hypothetical protein
MRKAIELEAISRRKVFSLAGLAAAAALAIPAAMLTVSEADAQTRGMERRDDRRDDRQDRRNERRSKKKKKQKKAS